MERELSRDDRSGLPGDGGGPPDDHLEQVRLRAEGFRDAAERALAGLDSGAAEAFLQQHAQRGAQ